MANIEFTDNSAIVNAAMNEELIAWLYEMGGEMEAQTKRNSSQGLFPPSLLISRYSIFCC